MKYNVREAQSRYRQMFGDSMSADAISKASHMTPQEFEEAQPGCDPDTGEYIDSPFSAGEWDCIDSARWD